MTMMAIMTHTTIMAISTVFSSVDKIMMIIPVFLQYSR